MVLGSKIQSNSKIACITGNPGTGKSCFGFYAAYCEFIRGGTVLYVRGGAKPVLFGSGTVTMIIIDVVNRYLE